MEAPCDITNYIDMIDALEDGKSYAKFAREILKQSNISMSIGLAKIEIKALAIGGNLLKNDSLKDQKFNFMLCVLYMQNKKTELIVNAKNLLKKLFTKNDLTIIFYESRPNLKVLKYLEIEISDVSDTISIMIPIIFSIGKKLLLSLHHEPNLQNVTKDFTVEYKDRKGLTHKELISFRSVFECKKGKMLISADFCQLEMRILTHLCKDPKLTEIMRCGNEDVFRKIAAKWNQIEEKNVTTTQRNQTIC
ncbi:hypothetical protein PVAND_009435 [Polypedilum vanderplanki]|uniref:DNA-directed DNA polymerase family A palm domain-containing protein n=1 Tax=Polypedilum vanderplanki TaxID=319348 RepID=A0A9J6CDP8_POLVA|nr:hypothetical protein PVAND_009435 [Polypedilum vanderplanki]